MSNQTPAPQLIDEQTASFITHAVSINIATRDANNRPTMTRAAGCRVADDGTSLTLFLTSEQNQQLLDNLRSNKLLAAVFSRPTTHQTIQFKGDDAEIVEITEEDRKAMQAYRESFMEELRGIGFPASFCEAIIPPLDDKFLAIRFTPDRAYSQTPGPNAGKKLSP